MRGHGVSFGRSLAKARKTKRLTASLRTRRRARGAPTESRLMEVAKYSLF